MKKLNLTRAQLVGMIISIGANLYNFKGDQFSEVNSLLLKLEKCFKGIEGKTVLEIERSGGGLPIGDKNAHDLVGVELDKLDWLDLLAILKLLDQDPINKLLHEVLYDIVKESFTLDDIQECNLQHDCRTMIMN